VHLTDPRKEAAINLTPAQQDPIREISSTAPDAAAVDAWILAQFRDFTFAARLTRIADIGRRPRGAASAPRPAIYVY
jgi:hypothetical protein